MKIVEDGNLSILFETSNSVFNSLTKEQKAELEAKAICSKYKKGEVIFRDGEEPKGLVCLTEGKVKLFKKGVGGKEQIVRLARPSGLLGYRAIFAGEKNQATAVAIETATVCVIEKDHLFSLIENNGKFALYFIRALSKELGFVYTRTITLTQKHIRGRLAETLLFLQDMYGIEDDGQTIKATLLREDIAKLSNMTTSNAIRTLSAFATEKIIELKGKKIKLVNIEELEKISSQG